MKFTSWPKPPIHCSKKPPAIPESFKLFGLQYKVENENPYLDVQSKPLDVVHMKACIDKSLRLFIDTLRTFDADSLNAIKDLHAHINEEINLARAFEGPGTIQECKNKRNTIYNETLDKIKEILEK